METASKHIYILLLVNILVVFICWKLNSPKESKNAHESLSKKTRSTSLSATEKYAMILTTCPDIEVADTQPQTGLRQIGGLCEHCPASYVRLFVEKQS